MKLEASGLRVSLKGREVLAGVDFAAEPGELTAVIGPNGAGKTTLLRVLAGLIAPAAGAAWLAGRALGNWSRADLARALAYLPQERTVHWALTARSVVALGRLPHQPMGANARPARIAQPSPQRSPPWTLRRWPAGRCWRCRVASGHACWWRVRWRRSHACCLPTSRPPASIPRTSSRCFVTLPRLRRRAAPWLSRCTICRLPRASVTGLCSSQAGRAVAAGRACRSANRLRTLPPPTASAPSIVQLMACPLCCHGTCCHDAAPVRRF